MDLEDILQSRNKQIAECEYYIEILIKEYNNLNDYNELKNLLQSKKFLLTSLNMQDFKNLPKILKDIDNEIYVYSNIIRSNIKDEKELKKFNSNFGSLVTKDDKFEYIDIIKFIINNNFLATVGFMFIGTFIFICYFISIEYFPILNKESFLYILIILFSVAIINISILVIMPIFIQLILKQEFQKKYLSKSQTLRIGIFLVFGTALCFGFFMTDNTILKITSIILILISAILISCEVYDTEAKAIFILKKSLYMLLIIFVIFLLLIIIIFILIYGSYISIMKNEDNAKMIIFLIFIYLFIIIINIFQIKGRKKISLVFYIIIVLVSSAFFSSDAMKRLHLGNYTPDVLILKPEAKAIIPSDFPFLNNTLKKPKILSNIGDEYYIELKTTPNKTLRLSIPKNLVLSEQNEVEEKPNETKDTKEQSKPEEKISQKTSQ